MTHEKLDDQLASTLHALELPPCPPGFEAAVMNRISMAKASKPIQRAPRLAWTLSLAGVIGFAGLELAALVKGPTDAGLALLIADRTRSLFSVPDLTISQDFAFLGFFSLAALVGLWRLLPAPAARP